MGDLTHRLDLSNRKPARPVRVAVLGGEVTQGEAPRRLWVVRPGTYRHPEVGIFSITSEDLSQIVANFDAELARRDGVPFLPVDIEHATIRANKNLKPHDELRMEDAEKRAFGFIASLEIDGQDVYAVIEWTEEGRALIASQGFRFTSPVVLFNWEDTEDGGPINGTRLHSLALTNQPVFSSGEPNAMAACVPIIASREAIVQLQKTPGVSNVKPHYRNNRDRAFPACVSFSLETEMAEPTQKTEPKTEPKIDDPKNEPVKMVTLSVDGADVSAEDVIALSVEIKDLKTKLEEAVKVIPPEGSVTLSVDAVTELQSDAKKGKEALAKIEENEAKARIALAISENRITPAMAADAAVIAASKSDATFAVVLATNPKGGTGFNTGESKGGEAGEGGTDPGTELVALAHSIGAEKKVNYGEAIRLACKKNPGLASSAGY